jgi:hypothetical protein
MTIFNNINIPSKQKLDDILSPDNKTKNKDILNLSSTDIKYILSPDNKLNKYNVMQYNEPEKYQDNKFNHLNLIKPNKKVHIDNITDIPELNITKALYKDDEIEFNANSKHHIGSIVYDANRQKQQDLNLIERSKMIKIRGKITQIFKRNSDTDLNVRERDVLEDVPCLSPTNKLEVEPGLMPKSIGEQNMSLYTSIKKSINKLKKKQQIYIT